MVGGSELLPGHGGEVCECGDVLVGFAQHCIDSGELPPDHGGNDVEFIVNVFGSMLGKDRADGGSNRL